MESGIGLGWAWGIGLIGFALGVACGVGAAYLTLCNSRRSKVLQEKCDALQREFDAAFRVEGIRPQEQTLTLKIAGKIFLGQRWSLVRQPAFLADEHDPAVEAFLPERGHNLSGSVTRAASPPMRSAIHASG